ncbi:hypothetical protein [Mycobacterium kyorinense]|uniref:Recombinase domain-containing protein n=1 Tax=Mycobacterium kyorinense TaxID=487514 RepID=A0A1X1XH61_9MYCO|nr:hypothetical protein [Mycobacterium kyorinense]ORV98083.1 hypothetical protein AWC14_14190 [Mycobacterium kyorinense]
MAHSAEHVPAESRVILLGDHDTVQHRDDLSANASRHNCTVAEAFGFEQGAAASTEDLTDVDAIVSALGCAIAGRMHVWVPFLAPDLGREQHWRRLSLVLQRHGLNLRYGRELEPFPTTGGYSEIDIALRREVQVVDELDHAALAAVGIKTLGREIERVLATASTAPTSARSLRRAAVEADQFESASAPMLPAPTTPWSQRQPMLKRYVRWLVHGCGVTQVATARVLNSTGQRTPKGRLWQPSTVSALLNGRYDHGAKASR